MENFVLYDEIGKFGKITMHKGRRKGTITFLAICCVDKNWRGKVTNHVRFVHEFDHERIVKFYEWYETSNHLWLVMELCTGGSLQQMIEEDKHLPESVIRAFGVDIVRGMHYIHSMGVLYSDWRPANLLLDGQGNMKYFDFTLTRKMDEDLTEVFENFVEDSTVSSQMSQSHTRETVDPCLNYLAPEVIQGKPYSTASDFWGLGCLLYEMYCGQQAFAASSERSLVEKILHRDPAPLKAKGSRLSGKASPAFQNLISGLLQKKPANRLQWNQLIQHEFWQAELVSLLDTDVELSLCSTPGSAGGRLITSVLSQPGSHTGRTNQSHSTTQEKQPQQPPSARSNKEVKQDLDSTDNSWPLSHPPRPATASANRPDVEGGAGIGSGGGPGSEVTDEVSFTMHLSSRSKPTDVPVLDGVPMVNALLQHTGGGGASSSTGGARSARAATSRDDEMDHKPWETLLKRLQDTTLCSQTTLLFDYNKFIRCNSSAQFDPKVVPVPVYSMTKLRSMASKEQARHLQQLSDQFTQLVDKGPPTQKRLHLVNYILSLSLDRGLADQLLQHALVRSCQQQLKDLLTQQAAPFVDLRVRLCRLAASVVSHASVETIVQSEMTLREELMTAAECLRDQFRVVKTKEPLLLLVGELSCALARVPQQQQPESTTGSSNVVFPASMVATQVLRCLHRSEDVLISTLASRIIESVSLNLSSQARVTCAWSNNDVVSALWSLVKHVNCDALRSAAIGALSALTSGHSALLSHAFSSTAAVAATAGSGGTAVGTGAGGASTGGTLTGGAAASGSSSAAAAAASGGGAVGSLVELMLLGSPRIQENVLNLLASVVCSAQARKLATMDTRQLVRGLLTLLDSPGLNASSRARVYIILGLVLSLSQHSTPGMIDALLLLCHQTNACPRLLNLMERDLRTLQHQTQETQSGTSAVLAGTAAAATAAAASGQDHARNLLSASVVKLHQLMLSMVPSLCTDVLHNLDAVRGRHHPAPPLVRRLKQTLLPGLSCVADMISCVTLRHRLVNDNLVQFVAQLLTHCEDIVAGLTGLDSALGGAANQEVCNLALCMVDQLVHAPDVVQQHQDGLIAWLMPCLAKIAVLPVADSANQRAFVESQMICLKLLADFMDCCCTGCERGRDNDLHHIVDTVIMAKAVTLMKTVESSALSVMHIINQHVRHSAHQHCLDNVMDSQVHVYLIQYLLAGVAQNPASSCLLSPTCLEALMLLASVVVRCAEFHRNDSGSGDSPAAEDNSSALIMDMVHEMELGPIMVAVTFNIHELATRWEGEAVVTTGILIGCLEVVNVVLKYVADVVRRALQVRRSGASRDSTARMEDKTAMQAEQLLLACRPLTELMPLLCQWLSHDEQDMSDHALRALSHLASLYGADQTSTPREDNAAAEGVLTDGNLYWIATALNKADTKRARLLLRIVKRLLVTYTAQGAAFPKALVHLTTLENALTAITCSAQIQVDSTLKQLAQEITAIIRNR